jgi:hypothetical protein
VLHFGEFALRGTGITPFDTTSPARNRSNQQSMLLCDRLPLRRLQFYEGYLPFDKSGDWFYQTCEVLALLMVAGLLIAASFV